MKFFENETKTSSTEMLGKGTQATFRLVLIRGEPRQPRFS